MRINNWRLILILCLYNTQLSTSGDDPTAIGGDSAATGGEPAADVPQSSHSCSSLPTRAPDIAPLLKKFTSFSYQIASGMVCWVGGEMIAMLHGACTV